MKRNNIFFDICAASTILGIVMWIISITCYTFTGITLYWIPFCGLAAFAIAAISFIVAVTMHCYGMLKCRRKGENKVE